MKWIFRLLPLVLLMGGANSYAWHVDGNVFCDVQPNGFIDEFDTPFEGVVVRVVRDPSGDYVGDVLTDTSGYYYKWLPAVSDLYKVSLRPSSLPDDAIIVLPPAGYEIIEVTASNYEHEVNFLVDSATCRVPQDGCWMTGGGVKFEPILREDLATHGPKDTMGGVVYPSCDGSPSNGGQWNHVAHSVKEHYQAFDITKVRCGNVEGHPPGSESPVTPFNFIEWEGVGRMKGIHGNKSSYETVHFFGRAEDRNEPGSDGPAVGGNIDRYFLHAFVTGPGGTPITIFCVDEDGDCSTVDPRTISGGNLQLHYSSCE